MDSDVIKELIGPPKSYTKYVVRVSNILNDDILYLSPPFMDKQSAMVDYLSISKRMANKKGIVVEVIRVIRANRASMPESTEIIASSIGVLGKDDRYVD